MLKENDYQLPFTTRKIDTTTKKNEVYATAIQLMHYLTSRQESKFEQPKKMLKIIASRAKSGIEKNGNQ